jgi:hypothetical protein
VGSTGLPRYYPHYPSVLFERARAAAPATRRPEIRNGAVGVHASTHLVAGTGAFSDVDLDATLLLAADVADVEYGPTVEIDEPGHGVRPRR